MSDPLSYSDAIVSAVTELARRTALFALVCIAAAFLGLNIHQAPLTVATYAGVNLSVHGVSLLLANWVAVLSHNMCVMWISPWTILYLPFYALVCRNEDTFKPLLFLATVHSIHAFAFMQSARPLAGAGFAAGLALLIVCEAATVALLLWWKYMRENTPLPEAYGAPRILAGGK